MGVIRPEMIEKEAGQASEPASLEGCIHSPFPRVVVSLKTASLIRYFFSMARKKCDSRAASIHPRLYRGSQLRSTA